MKKSFLQKQNKEFKFKYTPRFAKNGDVFLSESSYIGKRFAEGYLKKKNQSKIKNGFETNKIDLSEFRNHKKKNWLKEGGNIKTILLYLAIVLIFLYTILQFLGNFS